MADLELPEGLSPLSHETTPLSLAPGDDRFAVGLASIRLDVLADGRVAISSTFHGRADSSYMPMPDDRVPGEVAKLIAELREQQAQLDASGSA